MGHYHFERGQYQDDVADLAAVFPPVLRPLQAGDAHMAPLEVLDIAAGTEKENKEDSYIRGSPQQQQPNIHLSVSAPTGRCCSTDENIATVQLDSRFFLFMPHQPRNRLNNAALC